MGIPITGSGVMAAITPRKSGGHAGCGDYHLYAAGLRAGGKLLDLTRGAVSRKSIHLKGHLHLVEKIGCLFSVWEGHLCFP